MKDFWVLLICLLGPFWAASAQNGIGLRGGPSLSQASYTYAARLSGETIRPQQSLVQGFELGLVGRFMNTPHLGLQVEANYSRQGWHIYVQTEGEHKKELEIFQVPMLSFLQLGRGKLKFTVQAGAYGAYVFNRRDVLLPLVEDLPGKIRYSHQEELPWQFGILAGGGPSFRFPFGVLQLEARFSQAFSDLIKTDLQNNDDFVDFDSFRMQNITFGLQWVYMFESRR